MKSARALENPNRKFSEEHHVKEEDSRKKANKISSYASEVESFKNVKFAWEKLPREKIPWADDRDDCDCPIDPLAMAIP